MAAKVHHHDAETCGQIEATPMETDAVYLLVTADIAVLDVGNMIDGGAIL